MGQSLSVAFARVLKQHRLSAGLTQEALAHKAGLHPTYIGLIERGKRKPTIEKGHALARAMGIRLSELIREAEAKL